MRIIVHVKEKEMSIECGDGQQPLVWLAHVGIARFDGNAGKSLGAPSGIQDDRGNLLDLTATIAETLEEHQHVWVLLRNDEPMSMLPDDLAL